MAQPSLATAHQPTSPQPKGQRIFAPWEDPQARPFVELRNVTKSFGSFTAVDALDLVVYEREFFALLGPSGCGKSTILRMLAGFEAPSHGSLWLDGQEISQKPPYQRPVNMMFQSYALFPHMNVWDNIAFGLRQEGIPKAEIALRVEEMLTLVELTSFAKRKPDQLSGGQRQRVALARAIVKRPKLLLLDEPLAALDKRLREQTQFELMNLQERLGLTFIIVTHDQEEAMTVASRIAVMDKGRICQIATPPQIYEYPNSRYVAEFLGDMNILPGTIQAIDRNIASLSTPYSETALDVAFEGAPPSLQQNAWLAVRPEKVQLVKGHHEGKNCLRGVVWDIAYLGDFSCYNIKLTDGRILKAARANAKRLVDRDISWEDDVTVSWAPESAILLKA